MNRPSHPTALRVATWNVHACIGRDGRFAPERVADVLGSIEADVVALQEVDSRAALAGSLDTFDFLAQRVGSNTASVRTIRRRDGDYGHMVASRWPLVERAAHDLSVPGREPRRAIEFEVDTPLGRLWGLAAHLGLRRSERARQFDALQRIASSAPPGASLILGDFNEPRRRRAAAAFGGGFAAVPLRPTFPSAWPLFALDCIWYRPTLRLRRSWVPREGRQASDHMPLVAEFEIDGTVRP